MQTLAPTPYLFKHMMNTISAFSFKETQKSDILKDNKEKRDNRCWTHKKSGKSFVGSAINLINRSKNYFNEYYLETKRRK